MGSVGGSVPHGDAVRQPEITLDQVVDTPGASVDAVLEEEVTSALTNTNPLPDSVTLTEKKEKSVDSQEGPKKPSRAEVGLAVFSFAAKAALIGGAAVVFAPISIPLAVGYLGGSAAAAVTTASGQSGGAFF